MRGTAASMTVLRPKSAREALKSTPRTPDALPIVGGTDLMVLWNLGELNDRVMLDLSRISEWSRIEKVAPAGDCALRIGALATHAALQRHALVRRGFRLLADACATIGGIQIQNRGTIGGNIANASPAGDTFPPLAVYDARSARRQRDRPPRRPVPRHFRRREEDDARPGRADRSDRSALPRAIGRRASSSARSAPAPRRRSRKPSPPARSG